MPFELKITAASAQELAEQALTLGFLISPELRPGAKAVEPEIIEPEKPKRGPGRPKKGVTIEGEKVAESEADVRADTGSRDVGGAAGGSATGDAAGAAGQAGAGADAADGSGEGDVEQPAAQDDAAAEVDAVAGAGEGAPAASAEPDTRTLKEAGQDGPVRKRVINDYLNACFDSQDTRRDKFRELLDQFGVQALGDLPVAKLAEFEKAVDTAIEAATKKAAA